MSTLKEKIEKSNISSRIYYNKSMKEYTSFRIGGPADIVITPETYDEVISAVNYLKKEEIPLFILGGGSNLLVSDSGIRKVVILMSGLNDCSVKGKTLIAAAGVKISSASLTAYKNGLTGMEFIYGMPGTTGGAVWMNARCYDKSISDLLLWVEIIDQNLKLKRISSKDPEFDQFSYKMSPFQKNDSVILRAAFNLKAGNRFSILKTMSEHKLDRINKGHYNAPCAGSVFKNNREFGRSTGQILEKLGLCGRICGGAEILKSHGNIIINTGKGSASDVKYLIDLCKEAALREAGIKLEPEIQFIGE